MAIQNSWINILSKVSVAPFASLLVLAWILSVADAEGPATLDRRQALNSLHTEDSPGGMAEVVRKVFRNCDDNLIDRLCMHPDASASLFAAWEKTKRHNLAVHALPDRTHAKLEAVRSMAWFVGFVAGRVKVTLPKWWQSTVESGIFEYVGGAESNRDFIIGLSTEVPYPPLILAAPGILTHPSTSISIVDDRVIVRHKNSLITFSRKFIDQVTESQELPGNVILIASHLDANSSVVILHGFLPSDACLILCIDRESDKMLWGKKVRVIPRLGGGLSGPGPWHTMSVLGDTNRIVLFGAGPFEIYVTGFATKDGERLFTFFSGDE